MKLFQKFYIAWLFLVVLTNVAAQTYTINSEWEFLQTDTLAAGEVEQITG